MPDPDQINVTITPPPAINATVEEAGPPGSPGAPGVGFTLRGDWLIGTAYAINDVVSFADALYGAIKANTGVTPGTDPTTWALMVQGTSGIVDWASLTGKPSTFPPTLPITETDVTDLETDLAARVLNTDARLSDARTPTAHEATHLANGSDPIALASPTDAGLCPPVDNTTIQVQSGQLVATAQTPTWSSLTGKPNTFAPSSHAASHETGGSDVLTLTEAQITGLGADLSARVLSTDGRLADARTPVQHASTHAAGGSDAVTITEAQVTGLTTDLAGKLSASDPAVTNARPPTSHAGTHAAAGSDPLTLTEAQITGLVSDLASKATAGAAIPESQVTGLVSDLAAKLAATDPSITNARTPTVHHTTHAAAGTDPLTLTKAQISDFPTSLAPSAHAATHAAGGSDPLALSESQITGLVTDLAGKATAGAAIPESQVTGLVSDLAGKISATDASVTNARTPTTHASSHGAVGSDPITITEAQVTNLATDLAAKVGTSDSRLSDARTPTAHHTSHASAGSDPLTLVKAQISDFPSSMTPSAHAATHGSGGSDAVTLAQNQVTNLVTDLAGKLSATDPSVTNARTPTAHASSHLSAGADAIAIATTVLAGLCPAVDNVTIGIVASKLAVLAVAWSALTGVPSSFTPSAHASTHAHGGTDAVSITYADLLSKPTLGTSSPLDVPASGNASTSQVVKGDDTRLTNARTPSAHASTHASAGSDPLTLVLAQISDAGTAAAKNIPASGNASSSQVVYGTDTRLLAADGSTITNASGTISVGAIPESKVTNLPADLASRVNSTTIRVFKVSDGNPPATNYSYFGTRDSGTLAVWQFAGAGVDTSMIFTDVVPQGVTFPTGIQVVIFWGSTAATTGKAEFSAAIDNASTHSLDTDSYGTAVSTNTTTSGTAAFPNATTISLPIANLQSLGAELPYKLRITRRASDTTNDTIAEVVSVGWVLVRTY